MDAEVSDRCPWNWRLVELKCCAKACIDAMKEFGEEDDKGKLLEAVVRYYKREAYASALRREWLDGQGEFPE
eukprot:scaffold411413_cov31-Prasinocladus_malaysianus.AAC.1